MFDANLSVPCPHRPRCPGCPLFEMPYGEQIQKKQAILEGFLADFTDKLKPFVAAKNPLFYRNRAKLVLRPPWRYGLYEKGSHRLVDIPECRIHMDRLNEVAQFIVKEASKRKLNFYDERQHRGLLRYLILRQSRMHAGVLVVLVTRTEAFPEGRAFARLLRRKIPGLVGVIQNINASDGNVVEGDRSVILDGQGSLQDRIGRVQVTVSATTFLQGNHEMAGKIYLSLVADGHWKKEDLVYDLYAGIGLAGLHLAHHVRRVVGLEENALAVVDAKKTAQKNDCQNVEILNGDVEDGLAKLARKFGKPQAVILNPPRSGCRETTLKWLIEAPTKRLAYLSCSPKSLARDLNLLKNGGFQVTSLQGFDMYPQTDQIETLVFLQR